MAAWIDSKGNAKPSRSGCQSDWKPITGETGDFIGRRWRQALNGASLHHFRIQAGLGQSCCWRASWVLWWKMCRYGSKTWN